MVGNPDDVVKTCNGVVDAGVCRRTVGALGGGEVFHQDLARSGSGGIVGIE